MTFEIDINEIIKLRILILFYAYKKEFEGDIFIGNKKQFDEIGLDFTDNKIRFVLGYLVDDGYLRGSSTTTSGGRITCASGITPLGQRTVENIIKKSDVKDDQNQDVTVLDKVKSCIQTLDVCAEFIKIGATIFKDFQLG